MSVLLHESFRCNPFSSFPSRSVWCVLLMSIWCNTSLILCLWIALYMTWHKWMDGWCWQCGRRRQWRDITTTRSTATPARCRRPLHDERPPESRLQRHLRRRRRRRRRWRRRRGDIGETTSEVHRRTTCEIRQVSGQCCRVELVSLMVHAVHVRASCLDPHGIRQLVLVSCCAF